MIGKLKILDAATNALYLWPYSWKTVKTMKESSLMIFGNMHTNSFRIYNDLIGPESVENFMLFSENTIYWNSLELALLRKCNGGCHLWLSVIVVLENVDSNFHQWCHTFRNFSQVNIYQRQSSLIDCDQFVHYQIDQFRFFQFCSLDTTIFYFIIFVL